MEINKMIKRFLSTLLLGSFLVGLGPVATAKGKLEKVSSLNAKKAAPKKSAIVSQFLPYDTYKEAFENHEYVQLGDGFSFLTLGDQVHSIDELKFDAKLEMVEGKLPFIGSGVQQLIVKPLLRKSLGYHAAPRPELVQHYPTEAAGAASLAALKQEQVERKKQWFLGSFTQKNIVDGLSTIMIQTGVEFAIDMAGKAAHQQIKQLASDYKAPAFYTKKDGKVYKVFVQPPSEGEQILFNAIRIFGRISPDDFAVIKSKDHCDYELGSEVVPKISWKIKLRDQLAYGSAALFEAFCDASVNFALNEYDSSVNFVNADFGFKPSTVAQNHVKIEDVTNSSLWSRFSTTFASGFRTMAVTGIYQAIKYGVKGQINDAYKKWFPKYNMADIMPKKEPLGIANVDGVYRYVYADALLEDAGDELDDTASAEHDERDSVLDGDAETAMIDTRMGA